MRSRVGLAAALAVLAAATAATAAPAPAPAPAAPRAALAADFDGDGRADLYRPGPGRAHETFQFAQPGGFAVEHVPLVGTYVQRTGDFDGDGFADVLHFNPDGPDAVWYGGADRGLSRVPVSASGSSVPVVADYDGDGKADVYWSRPGGGADTVWYGRASRRFLSYAVAGVTDGHPVAGDFDADGRADLAWPGRDRARHGGATKGRFTWVAALTATGADRTLVGDFDGNGTDDVLWYRSGRSSVVVYNGPADLRQQVSVPSVGSGHDPAVGDFDGDGLDDVVLSGRGTDWVWYGTPLRRFEEVRADAGSLVPPVVADYDGDGRADVYWPDKGRIWHGESLRRWRVVPSLRETPNRLPAFDRARFRPYGYVAHAMGRVGRSNYTNSRQAFEVNYAAGFRTFEVDVLRLADGNLVAAHDRTEKWLDLPKRFRDATAADLKGRKWVGKYDLLFGRDLVDLLAKHRDAYFVLDTKWDHAEVLRAMYRMAADPQVARRIVPHVEGQADLDAMRRYYPVQHYVLALYRTQRLGFFDDDEVLELVRRNGTPAVMMWIGTRDPAKSLADNSAERRRYTPKFEAALRSAGAATFVHSTFDADVMSEFEERGIGVYADSALPPSNGSTSPLPGR